MHTSRLVALVAAVLLPTIALAADAPPPFLAGEGCLLQSTAAPSAGPPAVEQPLEDASWLSGCTAEADCGVHGTISCQGNTTCSAYDRDCSSLVNGRVTCDGTTTQCPHDPVCNDSCKDAYLACYSACNGDPECQFECKVDDKYCRCQC